MSNRHKRSSSAVGKLMAKRAGRARRERLRKHGKSAGLRDAALHAWMRLENPKERAAVLRSARRLREVIPPAGMLYVHLGTPVAPGDMIAAIPCSAFRITS